MSCRRASNASRHYGLLANGNRAANIARAGELLGMQAPMQEPEPEAATNDEPRVDPRPCPCCGGRMLVIEVFGRGCEPKHRPTPIVIGSTRHEPAIPSRLSRSRS
jgi:hypothetical protein